MLKLPKFAKTFQSSKMFRVPDSNPDQPILWFIRRTVRETYNANLEKSLWIRNLLHLFVRCFRSSLS